MVPAPTQINGQKEFEEFLKTNSKIAMVLFMEEWSENSVDTGVSLQAMLAESDMPTGIAFAKISAESKPEICKSHNITGVPTTLLFQNAKEVFRLSGTRVRELAAKLMFYASNPESESAPVTAPVAVPEPTVDLNERIKKLLSQADIMLFMKGSPAEPQCGFSRTIVGILNETGVPYSTFNILADNDIREGLKTFSNWRTYPQLYVKAQLIGGLDIVKELKESGDLMSTLKGQ